MKRQSYRRVQTIAVISALLSGAIAGCAPSMSTSAERSSAPSEAEMQAAMPAPITDAANKVAADGGASSPVLETVPRTQPQLVKSAQIGLTVESVSQSLDRVTAIARQNQGDVLGLQDQVPPDDRIRHTAFLQIRVPQAKLETTLAALAQLGTVRQQSISAEDVSNQLIDYQARLRNLRNTEEMLLTLMKRSGSVGDVLKVAQELSNVRSSIEQIDGQLTDLQNRVAYSVISINLEEAIASIPAQQPLATQMQDAWEQATHSVSQLTTNLLKLGVWLVAYSPYWLVLAVGAAALHHSRQRGTHQAIAPAPSEPPTSGS